MRTLPLPDGGEIPVLGQGTWRMGERAAARAAEVAALRHGLDLGLGLIDTAEMYGEGGAEEVVGDAIAGRRDEVFLVSKLYPRSARTKASTIQACERSLKRLRTDRIDLYLLHWRGGESLPDCVAGFEELKARGLIRHWGVSNFDVADVAELDRLPGGRTCAANQVYYSLWTRGIEWRLLPDARTRGMPVMAYSPLEQGRLDDRPALAAVAARRGITPAQAALAWVLHQPGVLAIPKAVKPEHVAQNRAALDVALTAEDLAELDRAFPRPSKGRPLDVA